MKCTAQCLHINKYTHSISLCKMKCTYTFYILTKFCEYSIIKNMFLHYYLLVSFFYKHHLHLNDCNLFIFWKSISMLASKFSNSSYLYEIPERACIDIRIFEIYPRIINISTSLLWELLLKYVLFSGCQNTYSLKF